MCLAAQAYVLAELPDIGLRLAESVLLDDPSNPAARFWAIIGAAWAMDFAKLDRHAREYVRRFGEDTEVYVWLAMSNLLRGRSEQARALTERAFQLDDVGVGKYRGAHFRALVEQRSGPPESRRRAWLEFEKIVEDGLGNSPRQTRLKLALMEARSMLGLRDSVAAAWDWLEARFDAEGRLATPDLDRAPYALLHAGDTLRARRAFAVIKRRSDIEVSPTPSPASRAVAVNNDLMIDLGPRQVYGASASLTDSVMTWVRARRAALREKYGDVAP